MSHRQQERFAAQEAEQPLTAPQQAPARAPESAGDDLLSRLERLGDLRDKGVLSPEEFEAQKAKILGG